MANMFNECKNLLSLDLSSFNTSKLKNVEGMFNNCCKLTSLDITNFDTSQIINMKELFRNCDDLKYLNISNFNTSSVINMDRMFSHCSSLTSLDLSHFDTSKVENMYKMICDCFKLINLNVSNFNTSSVKNMNDMFLNSYKLTSLDLSSFTMESVTNISYMFNNAANLEYINLSNSKPFEKVIIINIFKDTSKNLVICTKSTVVARQINNCNIISCSENWREEQKKIDNASNQCVDSCSKAKNKYDYLSKCVETCIAPLYTYEYLSKCFDICPSSTYAVDNKCERCHPNCKTCDGPFNNINSSCTSCFTPYRYFNNGNCLLNNIYVKTELSNETKYSYKKLKNLGYDMFNINDPFYQDICSTYTSKGNTDIILSDIINYIYNNDDTKCQPNCKLSKYSIESEYLNCSCTINEEINNMNEKFNSKKIYESFIDVLKYSNYKVIKCYNLVFTKYVITKNIGSIISLVYILIYFGSFIFFIIKGTKPLKDKLNLINVHECNVKYLNNNNKNKDIKGNIFNTTKKKKRRKRKKLNEIKKLVNNKLTENISTDNLVSNKIGTIEELNNFELNELDFYDAIKLDKRTFIQMYCGFLKREHPIIFTFFVCDDYNLIYIKLARFIFLMSTDMVMNVLFFSDESMHKLYLNYGKYDFIEQIPQILYSTIISRLFEILLCYLSLTDKPIYQMKKRSLKNHSMNLGFKCINIKLIIFFLFLLLYLYYFIGI